MSYEKKVIGVGGGICSGKTTVCKIFAECGAHYISADEIGWEVLDEIREELQSTFGQEIMKDDHIDRERLGTIVFSKKERVKTLNEMSHPLLKEKLLRRINGVSRGVVVVDAALLFEWPDILACVDVPILVTSDDQHKACRAREKGIAQEMYQRIQHVQKQDEDSRPNAQYIIANNGSLDDLRKRCQTIYEEITHDC